MKKRQDVELERGQVSAQLWRKKRASRSVPPTARRFPIGAEIVANEVRFRVWAPRSRHVAVELSNEVAAQPARVVELESEGNGYFSRGVPRAESFYKFRLERGSFPDPASRFQPQGPHGPSQIIDPSRYQWKDQQWKGVKTRGQVIYEMHIGTLTVEGNWAAASNQLEKLAELGITTLEVMPVAEFQGRFGWGYDGVNLFAPTRLYGQPDDFRAFVNQAHMLGLGVILDVVYNHLGPDGNYLREFSEDYFTDRYDNEWGDALNFDGDSSGPVRELFVSNARYWIEEFHLDGLRLDATQQVFDSSSDHILSAVTRAVRQAGGNRATFVVAENEPQDVRLMRSAEQGGFAMDAIWNDDFHHTAMVALTGRSEAYYSDYKGTPQEFISAAKRGFLFQGQWYNWQSKPRGTPTLGFHPAQFVTFLQNHDQIANSLFGQRLHQIGDPGRGKALTALLLLGPGTPMLFQGQEFNASKPFVFFCDAKSELSEMVIEGRRKFLSQFPSIAESASVIANPLEGKTFLRCKLDADDRKKNPEIYRLHFDLLRLRREDRVFSRVQAQSFDGAVLASEAFLLRFFGENDDDRLLLVNLGTDLALGSAPEPLLAPVAGKAWRLLWSSEDPRYGGSGTPPVCLDESWHVPGRAAIVLVPGPKKEVVHGKAGSTD